MATTPEPPPRAAAKSAAKRRPKPPPPPPERRHGLIQITVTIVGMMALGAALGVLVAHFAH